VLQPISTFEYCPMSKRDELYGELDQETFVQSIKFALAISKTEPLASMVVARQDPAPEITSDADLIEYVKANARTIHHPIGE
jgi:choline dehydrogenase-like flavoprotein